MAKKNQKTNDNNSKKQENSNYSKDDNRLEFEGEVIEKLRNNMYRVQITSQHIVLAYASGKMKLNSINIAVHDKVRVELTPYDLKRGRIVYRSK